jgi:hypothetical protein
VKIAAMWVKNSSCLSVTKGKVDIICPASCKNITQNLNEFVQYFFAGTLVTNLNKKILCLSGSLQHLY